MLDIRSLSWTNQGRAYASRIMCATAVILRVVLNLSAAGAQPEQFQVWWEGETAAADGTSRIACEYQWMPRHSSTGVYLSVRPDTDDPGIMALHASATLVATEITGTTYDAVFAVRPLASGRLLLAVFDGGSATNTMEIRELALEAQGLVVTRSFLTSERTGFGPIPGWLRAAMRSDPDFESGHISCATMPVEVSAFAPMARYQGLPGARPRRVANRFEFFCEYADDASRLDPQQATDALRMSAPRISTDASYLEISSADVVAIGRACLGTAPREFSVLVRSLRHSDSEDGTLFLRLLQTDTHGTSMLIMRSESGGLVGDDLYVVRPNGLSTLCTSHDLESAACSASGTDAQRDTDACTQFVPELDAAKDVYTRLYCPDRTGHSAAPTRVPSEPEATVRDPGADRVRTR